MDVEDFSAMDVPDVLEEVQIPSTVSSYFVEELAEVCPSQIV